MKSFMDNANAFSHGIAHKDARHGDAIRVETE